jgi:hypothetical protein
MPLSVTVLMNGLTIGSGVDSRVVDENIDGTKVSFYRVDHGVNGIDISDIGGNKQRFATAFLDFRASFISLVVDVIDRDNGAVFRQSDGNRLANSAGSARDQRNPSLEIYFHRFILIDNCATY